MAGAVLLALAVCMDTFFAAMGCAMSGIHIPKRCALLIAAVGAGFLGISLLTAQLLAAFLPAALLKYGGAAVLAVLGTVQLMKEALTALFRRVQPHFKWKALGLVVEICFDETMADADGSKTLSLSEAAAFSAALSLDSLASGLGAGIAAAWILPCLALTLVLGFMLTLAGARLGALGQRIRMQWLGGVMLLLLAVCRIF